MKRNCIIYGNCQVLPIRNHLLTSSTFTKYFNILELPVHLLDKVAGISDHYLTNCELFIYQHVSPSFSPVLSTDYIMTKLPANAIRISYPNCYFTGYFPHYIKDPGFPDFPYADTGVMALVQQGKPIHEILAILSDPDYYSHHHVTTILNSTLIQLRSREKDLNISISNYIENNFRDQYLFYTVNHPKFYVTSYIARQIISMLGISGHEIADISFEPYFHSWTQPIYPSVIKHLNLSFISSQDRCFAAFGKFNLSFQEYMMQHIEYLRNKTGSF
ncbi:WcbI family polysaccharide biosynthesis putative acetyltransferase [Paenibacillus mucilaginosus]|uniref:Polysaccharide biosynthesis enzyme WcbI domain-containing protein n=2 Tax=Paenibacillus mucilaginosus TaxID=61624 RepID=H6NMM4_9BACL|nr:WcbI family polysaccharide biosynthesis putative acetyltransferase [Paenibacillus mucilaginosus]AFC30361.1 hypothetical protein PM3016_3532 [Paenibacillus mucilaginosus 3016]AFH62634.1 hypothetical protein B2K_18220 [Paenibacillus mucilaginosus K02]MCG7214544.1 hypothetical protein [Paenibacillus mucilaginosus]WDM30824.1 hypothetical protein KCX80_17410 [Paenibacillus mucilaginosus]WFA18996.1 hypothetical protein ERY13_17815 [Paenibacillus mucilaginosus]